MPASHRMISRVALLFCTLFLFASATAGVLIAQETAGKKYVDDKYDFSVTVSAPWKDARLQDYAVPGVARAAFAGPRQSSIVVFVQEPGMAFTPRFLVDESAKSIEQNLGATIRAKEVRTVGGKQAMWLVVEAKGNGGAIDGKGDVATTQHWVAIPREKDIVVVLLTCPATDYEANKTSFEATIKAMVVGGKQAPAQLESK